MLIVSILLQSTWLVFLAGTLAGLFLYPRVRTWLRTLSYARAIGFNVLGITVLFYAVSLIISLIYNSLEQHEAFYSRTVLQSTGLYDGHRKS